MPRAQTVLKMMRQICLSLPDSRVTLTWDADGVRSASELRALILESYRLIAPKSSLAKLGASAAPARQRAVAGGKPKQPRKARAAGPARPRR